MAPASSFSLARFCPLFVLLLVVSYVLSVQAGLPEVLTRGNAQALHHALRVVGYSSSVDGATVTTGTIRLIIITECTGLYSMLILASAILAYPAPLPAKGFGLLAGMAFVLSVNLLRLLTVALVGLHWPRMFHLFHVYLWQLTLLLMIVLAWALWLHWVARYAARPDKPSEDCA